MNIINILEGIEKLVIELLLWIIFIPKTLFKIISDPNWVSDYVEEELDKKSDRFDNYMSPILLFLVSSLVLFIIATQVNVSGLKEIVEALQGEKGILAGLGFLSIPLLFSLATELFRGKGLTRKGIQRILYIQCYYFSPLTLSIFALVILDSILLDDFMSGLSAILAIIIFVLFIVAELKLIARELKSGIWKGIGILFGNIMVITVAGFMFLIFSLETETTSEIDASYEGEAETISDLSLPSSGEFSISIWGYEGSVGNYRLSLTESSETVANDYLNQQGASFPSSGSLEYGQFVDSKVTQNNATSTWTFNGDEGDTISISVKPDPEFDVLFDVLDAEGNSILKTERDYTFVIGAIGVLYLILIGVAVALGVRSLFRKPQIAVKQGEKT